MLIALLIKINMIMIVIIIIIIIMMVMMMMMMLLVGLKKHVGLNKARQTREFF